MATAAGYRTGDLIGARIGRKVAVRERSAQGKPAPYAAEGRLPAPPILRPPITLPSFMGGALCPQSALQGLTNQSFSVWLKPCLYGWSNADYTALPAPVLRAFFDPDRIETMGHCKNPHIAFIIRSNQENKEVLVW